LLAFASAVVGHDGQPGNLANALTVQFGRVDDVAVQGGFTGHLEGQRCVQVLRVGHHHPGTARQPGGCVRAAYQALYGAVVVFIGFALVFAHGFEAQFARIHVVAYEEYVVDTGFVERWGYLEVLLVAIAKIKPCFF
jgi:hypothetical protein